MTGHPPAPGVASAIAGANTGTVLSATQAGGYTYIEVDEHGTTRWLASSPVRVSQGDEISWGESAVMRNFTSKSLGRTFDELLFVSNVAPAGATPAVGGNLGKVLSLTQAAGYAYIELETAQGVKWLAASQAPVQVGDTVTWQGGSVMNNFSSSSLNRTFDQIIFVAAVSPTQ
jgi:plastocyanin